ncbi:MAG TPA: helix-turn-helix transcriptional regulator [Candidatus Eisenbacteria bacterium]|jgi:transcriptional regulator with XRE-family HTH domain
MNDKFGTLGQQIRRLREAKGWTLANLAEHAGTSAPTIHRYENGWDRFELETLRKISSVLGARLEIRLVPAGRPAGARRASARSLVRSLKPLFWERTLRESDLARHPRWVLERVLTSGSRAQARAARRFFGDEAVRAAVGRRGVDARTRAYWRLVLEGGKLESQGRRH